MNGHTAIELLTHLIEGQSDYQQTNYCMPVILCWALLVDRPRRRLPTMNGVTQHALEVVDQPKRKAEFLVGVVQLHQALLRDGVNAQYNPRGDDGARCEQQFANE